MSDGRIDDEMIEISDPELESVVVEPPPKVVIEYRDRGVPWMVIPPLLMICAMGAVVAYIKFGNKLPQSVATSLPVHGTTSQPPAEAIPPQAEITAESRAKASAVIDQIIKTSIDKTIQETNQDQAAESRAGTPENVAGKPAEPAKSEVELPAVAGLPASPEQRAEAPNFPRTTGLGFDPKALEAERKNEVPATDPSIAPAVRQDPPVEPAKPVVDEKDLSTKVDAELLPPDPRQAKVRQKKRVDEALSQVEADRTRFHNDLREICRVARENYLKEVKDLSERYGMQVDPKIRKKAIEHLGKTGPYAGADRPTRIDVLRALAFPETLILEDVFNFETGRIGERNGPRNESDAMHRAILFLLRYAPGQRAASRSSASRSTSPPPAPGPVFYSGPNPGGR